MSNRRMPLRDILVIAALFALMIAWGPLYHLLFGAPRQPAAAPVEGATNAVAPVAATGAPSARAERPALPAGPVAEAGPAGGQPPPTAEIAVPRPEAEPVVREPEQRFEIGDDRVRLTLTSRGGGIVEAELKPYAVTRAPDSPRVTLDFASAPALVYEGLAGLGSNSAFTIAVAKDGGSAVLEARNAAGLRLVRRVGVSGRFRISVEDRFSNEGRGPVGLPGHGLQVGPMRMIEGETPARGMQYLGLDTLRATGGEGVRYWARRGFFSREPALPDFFQEEARRGGGCAMNKPRMTRPLPGSVRQTLGGDFDWVAVKNKFFVQILAPEGGGSGCTLVAVRRVSPAEQPGEPRTWDSVPALDEVGAVLRFEGRALAPGESFQRVTRYYVGPKELASLRVLGNHQDEVMEFGTWDWLCRGLLWTLSFLHRIIPNYGVAIILLTILIRLVFWPLTHKSTESMKKMQEIQPKLAALKEKYKDKPQKIQQETMALYREHKINPLGGCLPMLIQIPVMFALYNVLRSAIELRHAAFLWIGDLSEAENLFQGMIPLIGSLNILPLIMAATQAWQQHLTPAGGDPMQQRMMMFMPLVMLVFFYSLPSALVLYWSTNQVLMIIQMLWQKRKKRAAAPAAGG